MAELSIGDAVGAGFQVIRRHPWAVVSWGLTQVILGLAAVALFGSLYFDVFSQMLGNGGLAAGPHAPINTSLSSEIFQRLSQAQGVSMLVNIGGIFVRTVVYCAVMRAILHPEESRFAYLRLGAAELYLSMLTVAASFALVVAMIVPIIVIGMVVAGLALAHAVPAAVIVGVLGGVALFFALIYVALRFALLAPMMVDDGKFHFLDAWVLTKRHAGGLFVIALCLLAILIVGYIVVALLALITGIGVLGSAAGGLSHLETFFHKPPSEIFSSLSPFLVVGALVSVPLIGCFFAITGAPWARVYRDLSGPDLAATFA